MSGLRLPLTLVSLTVLWLGLWADLSVANVLAGLAIGWVVLMASGGAPSPDSRDDASRVSVLWSLFFIGWVLAKLVQSNLVLTWEIVTPRTRIHTGVVAVPMRTDSRAVFLLVGNVITLTPGTLTLEVAGSPPTIYVHVLHLHDVERVRQDLRRVEELAVRACGSRRARAELAASLAGASS